MFSKIHCRYPSRPGWAMRRRRNSAALLDLYNRYPIACLTVHPRVRKEKYRGPVHLDVFADALANSRNPVCYNGDLRTVGEVRALEGRFPEVTHVMIGRGLVADPALARKLRGGKGTDREELTDFLAALYQGYTDFYQGRSPLPPSGCRRCGST
ncbi:MAG: tRNA-dihydrouridine synthase [Dysosmobacter sp.]